MEQINPDIADEILKKQKSSGFRMPAEWHTHAATLLHWPSNRETWPGDRLAAVEHIYLELIDVLHHFEPVVLLAAPDVKARAEKKLIECKIDSARITLIEYPVNDVWARDCGPVFVNTVRGAYSEFVITDWVYNAWGGKYPPYESDNKIPSFLARRFDIPVIQPGMVLEGGSIETNGKGVFLTTESVLLNPNRNPDLSKEAIENRLNYYLGAEKIIWLKNGLKGDDTDGHIDDLARFTGEKSIMTCLPENSEDINYPVLNENLQVLKEATDADGRNFDIEILPLPETTAKEVTVDGSVHVPATYLNFYIANGVVLVPLYDDRYDSQVIETFKNHFPDREIRGIHCSDLVWGQGSIHCITQQLYAIKL